MTYLLLMILLLGELQVGRGAQLSHVMKLPGIDKELSLKPKQLNPIFNAEAEVDFLREKHSSLVEFSKAEEGVYRPLLSEAQLKRAREIRFQESVKWGCIPAAMAGEGIEIQEDDLEILKLDSEDLFERVDAVYKELRYEQSKKLFSAHFSDEKLDEMFGPRFEFKEQSSRNRGYAPTNHIKGRLKKMREEEKGNGPRGDPRIEPKPPSRRR